MRRILITGAASGIGLATAQRLRERGARVVGLDVQPGPGIVTCDVRDQAAVDTAVAQAVAQLGGLDVLINCAGIGEPQSAAAPPGDDALRVLEVNLLGPWRVTAAAIPDLRVARGRVINVASGLAHITVPLATAYCMSKKGVVAYSDALRSEMAGAVAVTTVYPGYIRTPIHAAAAAEGVSLEGLVPAERVQDAARALTRAALSRRPRRDVATTRRGALGYGLLRLMPRGVVDRALARHMRRAVRRGHFDGAQIAANLRADAA